MPEIAPNQKNSAKPRWLLMLAIIFFAFLILAAATGLAVFNNRFGDKIYPNVFVGNYNLGGQSAEQAKQLINQEVDKISQHGIIFSYRGRQTAIAPVIFSSDGALARQIIGFSADQTVVEALNYGKSDNYFISLKNKLLALITRKQLFLKVLVNQEEIIKILKNNFSATYEPAQDAGLIIKKTPSTGDYEFSLAKEKYGKIIDYEEVIGLLIANLSKLDPAPIKLSTITQYPKIFSRDCLNIESKARKILNLAPLTLKYGENKWIIDQNLLTQFLALKPGRSTADKVMVGLNDNKFKAYLAEQIVPAIDKKPIEAKFEINNGRVTEFQNSQNGLTLNVESSFIKIENDITASPAADSGQLGEIELIVNLEPALIGPDNINNFGIKEIIGVGTSTFAGSPVNRRHNIKVGGDSVNGLLIKPGEEFSLLKALGEVDGSTGYLPELVIKENKTTPEYGGGLCQVGTTMFRASLASGLPITMRRNHSYRVVYYEPAGTDATIYNPWPDFRFINDMPTYILIQTKISGDILSFEFWGARDGRLAEKTRPTIYNIVKPEPTKIVETLDLKPGEKKCTENAHNGADAYFDYQVAYPDGEIKKKRFSSHYVPWQEVCLLGVEKLSAPPDAASSTPAMAETTPTAN